MRTVVPALTAGTVARMGVANKQLCDRCGVFHNVDACPSGRVPAPAGFLCPTCGRGTLSPANQVSGGMSACAVCGHAAYAGYLAEAEALQVQARALQERSVWLHGMIASGAPAPDRRTAAAWNVWPAPAPGLAGAGQAKWAGPAGGVPARPASGGSAQKLLLLLGGGSLVVAALLVAGVVWQRSGDVGRLALMLGATVALLAGGARLLASARLRQTGSTLVIVGWTLAVADLLYVLPQAFPALEWTGSAWPSPYPAAALAALAVVSYVSAHRWRSRAFLACGLVAAAPASVLAFVYVGSLLEDLDALREVWPAPTAAVCVIVAASLWRPSTRGKWSSGGADLGADVGSYRSAWATSLRILAAVVLTPPVFVLPANYPLTTQWATWVSWMVALGVVSVVVYRAASQSGTAVSGVGRVTGAAVGSRALLLPVLVAAAGVGVLLAPAMLGVPVVVRAGAAAVFGAGLLLVPVLRRVVPVDVRLAQGATGAAVAWCGWVVGFTGQGEQSWDSPAVTCFASVVAVSVYALAWIPPRFSVAAWVAVAPAAVAVLTALESFSRSYDVVERWTVPLAVLLALAGATRWVQNRKRSTLETVLPAVGVLLIPGALAIWPGVASGDLGWVRVVVVLVVGFGLVVGGLRLRMGGLFVPGVVSLVVSLAAVFWVVQGPLPRWVTFTVVGAALVLLAARLEWVRGRVSLWAENLSDMK